VEVEKREEVAGSGEKKRERREEKERFFPNGPPCAKTSASGCTVDRREREDEGEGRGSA
jgi:hypothetical protein